MNRQLLPLLFMLLLMACGSPSPEKKSVEKREPAVNPDEKSFSSYLPSMVTITTYDGERRLEEGFGFFVGEGMVVALNSQFNNCNRAVIASWGGGDDELAGFLAVDRINNLVLLKTRSMSHPPLKLYSGEVPVGAITYLCGQQTGNIIPVNKGRVLQELTASGTKNYSISNQIAWGSEGRPVFLNNNEVLGVAIVRMVQITRETLAIPSAAITALLQKGNQPMQPLSQLSGKVDPAISAANARIKGVQLVTDMGNITLRLFNDAPEYRDNFLKLAREHYYDSLLWHRVIAGFVVQSGAADTRHAQHDDVVGWKGPGYTLPADIHPRVFHRRGAVGVPRLPDEQNRHKRSDGSQFYIVTGRIYTDAELNEIEKEKHIRFTPQQRETYRTIGGAPTLDNEYSIFGEVIGGMDVADRINAVEVKGDFRPNKDIRLLKVKILQ